MPSERRFPLAIVWGLFLVLLLAAAGALVIDRANKSRSRIPVLWELPWFEFVRQDGRPFGSDDMKGKLNVVDFIFTTCPSICPVMSARMAELYRFYSESDLVQFVSISVDPDRDTLAALNEYAKAYGINDDRWGFLRAPLTDVIWVSEEGFKLPAEELPMGHSTRFVLVDNMGYIRSYHDSFDDAALESLKANIRVLARNLKP